METKSEIRSECLKIRKNLPKREADISIFVSDETFKKAKVVFCYVSAKSEIGTHRLLEELIKEKEVVVPYCCDNEGNMISVKIEGLDSLKEGRFQIPEPKNPVEFDKNLIDVVIVPAVAFDKNGNRLGYGKGYYDRFLADISPYKIGICHKELIIDSVLVQPHDIKMDRIIAL